MNNTRRKAIQVLIDKLEEIKGEIEAMQQEEQDYIDNVPENLQGGERYSQAEEAVSNIEYSVDNVQEAIDNLQNSIKS